MVAESGFPVESLFAGSIIVDSPMSCIVSDVPAPTLLLSPSSLENERHSAPVSSSFSDITKPQVPQNSSPLFSSVIIVDLPQLGQR